MSLGWDDIGFATSRIPWHDRAGLNLWPNGARLAVLLYIAPEEWDWAVAGRPPLGAVDRTFRDLSIDDRSTIAYSYNVGIRRQARALRELGVTMTLMTSGVTVLQHRDVLAELVDAGHELAAHGFSQGSFMGRLSREEQREAIEQTVELLQGLTGRPPRGWIGPGISWTEDTIELLVSAGFQYDADPQDDELPYYMFTSEGRILIIPYRSVGNVNDVPVFAQSNKSMDEALAHLQQSFDAHYREAARVPLLFSYGMHPFVSGRPDTCEVMVRFIEHILAFDDVWITTYQGLADWWDNKFLSDLTVGAPLLVNR